MHLRFDRGTVLLSGSPAGLDLSDLPGVLWDPRVQALRAPGRFLDAIRAELERRGVRADDQAGRPTDLDHPLAEPTLRPYQDAALWAWERAGRRGLVVLPTGSGKTRLATAAVARLRRNVGEGDLPVGATVVRYRRRVDPRLVLEAMGVAPRARTPTRTDGGLGDRDAGTANQAEAPDDP